MMSNNQKRKSVYWVTIVLASILLVEGSSLCFGQDVVWTVTHNPSGSDEHATSICADGTYIYIAGYDWSPGDLQWRIQKRNKSDGSVVWTVTENPSTSNDNLLSIACDDSYIYLGGYDSSLGYEQWRIQKRNKSDGSIVWTKTDIPVVSIVYAITCDDTYIYAAGLDRSPGDSEWRIEKRNKSDGSVVWTKTENPSTEAEGAQAITSDDSYIYITGGDYSPGGFGDSQCRIQKRNKSDGSVVWTVTENPSSTYDGAGAITCDDTYLYTAGHDSSLGGLHDDQWRIQKRNKSDGSVVWTETEDLSSSYDTAYAITSDDNYIYVCGRDSSPGYFNFQWRIQKRNKSDGSVVWTETENPGSGEDYPFAITSDSTYIYLAGCDSSQGDEQWRIQKRETEPPCWKEVFFDDFDDGNYDGWSVTHPKTGEPATAPAIVPSPEGYSLRGVGSGYSQDPGLNVFLTYPLVINNAGQLKVEMRAKSGPQWPNSAWVVLISGDDSYSFGDYGEGNQWAQFTPNVDGQSEWYNYSINANVWHDFAWIRDADGWWSLYIDGNLVWEDFCQDNRLTSFYPIGMHILRDQSEIEWVRISGVCAIPVAVDIKPQSCPNPLNVKSKGMLPVAILGTEDFDANAIDPASIRLKYGDDSEGVAPLRSSLEDVATPADGDECECSEDGSDGHTDLTLKFKTQEIVAALGDVNSGDVLPLDLTGLLNDGTPIEGTDCMVVVGNFKAFKKGDINKDGITDAIDFTLMAETRLQSTVEDN